MTLGLPRPGCLPHRQQLLAATDIELATIAARVANGKLRRADDIGVTVGKIVNKYKMAKHFTLDITDNTFDYHHEQEQIDAEAAGMPSLMGFPLFRWVRPLYARLRPQP